MSTAVWQLKVKLSLCINRLKESVYQLLSSDQPENVTFFCRSCRRCSDPEVRRVWSDGRRESLNFRFQSNSRSLIDIELPVSPKRTNGLVMPRFYLGFWQARASLLILSVKALAIICIYSTSYEFEVYWTAAVTNFWQASCNRKVCMKRCGALLALWGRVKSASSWCPQANDLPSWGDFQGCQSSCIWTWVSKVKQLESIKYEPKFKTQFAIPVAGRFASIMSGQLGGMSLKRCWKFCTLRV